MPTLSLELGIPSTPVQAPLQIEGSLQFPVVALHVGAAWTLFTETKEKKPNNVIINKDALILEKIFIYTCYFNILLIIPLVIGPKYPTAGVILLAF